MEKSPRRSTRTSASYFSPNRALVVHDTRLGWQIGTDLRIHQALDLDELLGCDRLEVREIEAQPVRRDERALLQHVGAEHLAQRRMQEVGRGVVERGRLAAHTIDLSLELIADADATLEERADVAHAIPENAQQQRYRAHDSDSDQAQHCAQ